MLDLAAEFIAPCISALALVSILWMANTPFLYCVLITVITYGQAFVAYRAGYGAGWYGALLSVQDDEDDKDFQ